MNPVKTSVFFQVPDHPDKFYKQYLDDFFADSRETAIEQARFNYQGQGVKTIKLRFIDSDQNQLEDAIINFDS